MALFTISLDHDHKLVKVISTGEFKVADGHRMITEARRTAAEYSYNLLYDSRESTLDVEFGDWLELPKKLDALKGEAARKMAVAIVVINARDDSTGFVFYEFVAKNAGLRVRLFSDEPSALKWLSDPRD